MAQRVSASKMAVGIFLEKHFFALPIAKDRRIRASCHCADASDSLGRRKISPRREQDFVIIPAR
jgi:hypothetical protein